MKRIIYLPLILTILISCKGKDDQDGAADNRLNESPDLIHQFKPVIYGVWVKKNYIKKLVKSKSPLAAAERVTGITSLYIDTAKLKADSIIVPVSWNNHKGANVALKFQPGKNTTTIMLGDDELSYSIKRNDTTLIIYHYDDATKETITSKYIRALNTQPAGDFNYGMNYMINKGLMAGKYNATDNAGKTYNVTFTEDGKVSGLPGLSTYFVQNDMTGAKQEVDVILFNRGTTNPIVYAFEKTKKTLNLYQTTAKADSTLTMGNVVYKLTSHK
jgi:hypothetical protein